MKLKNKFYLLFFVSTVLVITTVQVLNLCRERKAFYAKLEERGFVLSKTLSITSLTSFATNNFSDLKFYIDELARSEDIEYIIITDPFGKVILYTNSSQNSEMLYDPVSIRAARAREPIHQEYTTKNGRIYEVSSPIQLASLKWGTVRVGFNLGKFNEDFTRALQFFLLFSLGVIATTSLFFLIIGDKITQPIEELIKASQQIERGDFSVKIPVKSKDEIGKLSHFFNRMAETLKKKKDELEEAHKSSSFSNEKLRKKIEDLSILNKATKVLKSSIFPEKKFNLILRIVMNVSQARAVYFFSPDKKGHLRLKNWQGLQQNDDFPSRLAEKAAKTRKPLGVVNEKEMEINFNLPSPTDEECISNFAYPLLTRNTLWGVVVLDLSQKSCGLDELQAVATFLEEVGVIIENSFLMRVMLESKQIDSFNKLSSIMLHDLRGAVANLSLSLHNAKKYYYDPKFREDFLATIFNSVRKIKSLSEKINQCPTSLELKPCSINQILRGIVDELELKKLKNISLNEKYGDIPLLMLDTPSIKRVFRNIIDNALEAMPQGGILEISSYLRSSDSYVYITIKDTGVGMSSDFIQNHLFKPFVTTKKKGLGLALYSAREIVHMHGGEIEVESIPGKGTTFSVKLPLFSQNLGKGVIRKKLGQYLLDMGVITEEKLKEAMKIQATDKRRIGKILIDMGYIRKSEMESALETQKEAERRMFEQLMKENL